MNCFGNKGKFSKFTKYSVLLFITGFGSISSANSNSPNIVFFFIDDLGYFDLGCYGSEVIETPAIDNLCNEGLKFTNAYVSAAVCSPSRASALSGRHCLELGLWNASHRVKPNTLIFPKLLSDSGYQTWHLGKWHMGRKADRTSPEDLGFDYGRGGDESWDPGSHFYPYRRAELPNHPGLNVPDMREGGKEGEYIADRLTDEAIKLIDNRDTEKPFYLSLWHYGVHSPHEAKAEKIKKYKSILENHDDQKADRIDPVTGTKYLSKPSSAIYCAMVESIDESVGRIVDRLKREGLYSNTLFIFYSDNGPVACAQMNSLRGYKNSLYEGGVRVPAFFCWEGQIQPGVSDARIWTLDLFDTVLDVAGIEASALSSSDEGMSLVPHLTSREPIPGREFYWYFPEDRLSWGQRASTVILDENDMKYHLFIGDYEPELYDLKSDKSESRNLISIYPEKAQQLDNRLKAKMRLLYPGLPKPPAKYESLVPSIEKKLGIR